MCASGSTRAALLAGAAFLALAATPAPPAAADDPSAPSSPVRLVFVHHSTGGQWLADPDDNPIGGDLGAELMANNYFVSATNYGWTVDEDVIGDRTDIGNWWEWFRGPTSDAVMAALYAESGQNLGGFGSWPRLATEPPGENDVVVFKSCFPNSALGGSPDDPVPAIGDNPLKGQDAYSEHHTVANAKGIYVDLLEYVRTRPDKLFVVVTAPPLSDDTWAANARAFNLWLVHDWLDGYPLRNVAVFDFYNVLTSNGGDPDTNDFGLAGGNHHRVWSGSEQHVHPVNQDTLAYPSDDDHPNHAGNVKATGEFVPLLNVFYHRWRSRPATDFDADGKADVFWRKASTGQDAIWLMNGAATKSGAVLSTVGSPWGVADAGDLDGDGKADVVWRNSTSGENAVWFMNGTAVASGALLTTVPAPWAIAWAADFDGDGKSDLLWRNATSGDTAIWLMNGATVAGGDVLPAMPSAWQPGVGDVSGDGKADILWFNTSTGQTAFWLMNGTAIASGGYGPTVATTWAPAGVGDFDGNGKSDLLWRNGTSGENAIWLMDGASVASGAVLSTVGSPWSVGGVDDFDGDGKADIWWRNGSSGENAIWFMNGTAVASGGYATTLGDTGWVVEQP